MPTRRSLLRTAGLVGVGTVGGILAAPSPPDATPVDRTVEGAEPPRAVDRWTDGRAITTEDATPVARYQYMPTGDGVDRSDRDAFVATAPINVVFVPDADAETDREALDRVVDVLLEEEDWLPNPEEYARFAWDRIENEFVLQQATAAETYYGANGRLHVRCWAFEGIVSMQAHEDTDARPEHGIASYRRGRTLMEAIYDAAGWTVAPATLDLDNGKLDYDGVATVITEDP